MQIDWHGQTAETPELTVSYARAGKGMPVVFLHGWPEWKQTWQHNLPVLSQHFDCIAPDLRGFGRTTSKVARPPDGAPPQLLAKDLRDFADARTAARPRCAVGSESSDQSDLADAPRV